MKVKFHSDYSVEKRGFKAAWRQIPGIMAEDIITSNNFPQNYQNNFDQVRIIVKKDSIIENWCLKNLIISELATQGTGSRREDSSHLHIVWCWGWEELRIRLCRGVLWILQPQVLRRLPSWTHHQHRQHHVGQVPQRPIGHQVRLQSGVDWSVIEQSEELDGFIFALLENWLITCNMLVVNK